MFLFTSQYPFGRGEDFIENELIVLAPKFTTIYIFPLNSSGNKRALPFNNIEIVNWKENYQYNGLQTLLKNLGMFIHIYLQEFFATRKKGAFMKLSSELRSLLLQHIARANEVRSFIEEKKTGDDIFYTYWFSDWAVILGILKIKNKISSFCSRAHGFDLYEERARNGIIPFRYFQMKSVKKVFAISKNGREYLADKFQEYRDKISLSYLGVFDNGINPLMPQLSFTIVSCSSLIPLKRVHLIIEILKHINLNVNWVHFGDGELRDELLKETKLLSSNISVQFKGHINNDELINFYKKTPVHLFITTSETEGLPVSLQEAISFGIPAIATDVGGISEIINEHTGFLIEKEFNVEHIAKLIMEFERSEKNTSEFRNKVKAYWENRFNASANYADFFYQLTGN